MMKIDYEQMLKFQKNNIRAGKLNLPMKIQAQVPMQSMNDQRQPYHQRAPYQNNLSQNSEEDVNVRCMNYTEHKYKPVPIPHQHNQVINHAETQDENLIKIQDQSEYKRPPPSRNRRGVMSNSVDIGREHLQFNFQGSHPNMRQIYQSQHTLEDLNLQIEDLQLIREENNKELIRLEIELNKEREYSGQLLNERDTLIEALNDLSTKCNEVSGYSSL